MLLNVAAVFLLFPFVHSELKVDLVWKSDRIRGTVWCDKAKSFFFTSHSKFCNYCPATNETNCINLSGELLSTVLGSEDNTFYMVQNNKNIMKVAWDGKSEKEDSCEQVTTINSDLKEPDSRGSGVDLKKRMLLAVTDMGKANNSAVFSIDKQKNIVKHLSGLEKADGAAYITYEKVYLTDSYGKQVAIYGYDQETGDYYDRQVFDLSSVEGVEGDARDLVTDKNKNLWVIFPGTVVQVDPSGKVLQRVDLPVTGLNCLKWGNENLDVLYVGSEKELLTEEEKIEQPDCGSLYCISNTGTCGKQELRADL